MTTLARLLSLARMGAPLPPPGSRLRDAEDAVARARSLAREELQGDATRWALRAAACLWPAVAAAQALVNLRRDGRAARAASGRGLRRQLVDQLALAWRHDLTPAAYYRFRLFEPELRARAASFIPEHELTALVRRLNRGLVWDELDDKRAFHAHCARHGLPTAPPVLWADAGELHDVPDHLPRVDLIVKPCRLSGGRGLERWLFDPSSDTWTRLDRALDERGLIEHVRSRSRAWPYLVQERVHPHPELSDLAPGVLCTLRIVTCRSPGGAVDLVEALLRTPGVKGEVVDNLAAGGLGANVVDLAAGVLGPGLSGVVSHDRHPLGGAPLRGRRLPGWPAVRALCARAHDTVPSFAFVGWDVAITAGGPLLIEANTLFGVPDVPLGDTPFVACALAHEEAREARFTRAPLAPAVAAVSSRPSPPKVEALAPCAR